MKEEKLISAQRIYGPFSHNPVLIQTWRIAPGIAQSPPEKLETLEKLETPLEKLETQEKLKARRLS